MKRNKTIRILLSLIVLLTTGGVSRVCAETIDNVSYRDANGDQQTANNVTVLTGEETTLGTANETTWYIARGSLNYTSTLTLNGTVNLILEDNAVMSVGTEATPVVGDAIAANGDFTIYSQGSGTTEGKLIAIGSNDPSETYSHHYGIFAEANVTINGGIINATGGDDGIKVKGESPSTGFTLTINGGDITAKGTRYCGFYGEINASVVINGGKFKAIGQLNNSDTSTRGISTDEGTIEINGGEVNATGTTYGITTNYQGKIIINGGQVTATSTGTKYYPYGIRSTGGLTLSWTNSDDFIYANSYGNGSIKAKSGKKFIAYNTADGFAASGIIQGQGSEGYISTSSFNGKYLRPRVDGNLVQVDAAKGITASGYKRAYDLTNNSVTTHYYIYDENDNVTLNLPNYGQNGAEFTSTPANTIANAETTDGSVLASTSFQMPASDVTITDAKYYNYEVDYQTWNATDQKLVSAQTDANTKVYILEGTHDATTLDGGWYIVKNTNTDANVNEGIDANYTGRLTFSGEAHLILADGADMNINYYASNTTSNYGIQSNYNFSIYRQAVGEGTGKLTIRKSGDGLGISLGGNSADFVMTGGILDVKSPGTCIATSNGNINIYGGKVTAKSYKLVGEEEQISDYYAFNANGAINILGGQVEAYGGGGDDKIAINAKAGDLTLGWTNPEDYIKASSYKALTGYNVKTAIGKRFVAYDAETGVAANASSLSLGSATSTQATEIPNTISLTDAAAENTIAGKYLRPFNGYYVKDEAGLTFDGKTNADGSAKPDFTITTDAGTANEVTTPYYIYKANTDQNPVSVVVNSTGHADDHMEISATTATAAITQSDAEASSHCFAMPAADVTITGIKYYTYGVDYIDPTAAANEQAKTTPANTKVYILEGTHGATALAGGWYVVKNTNTDANVNSGIDAEFTGQLQINGETHLILADGAEMTVNSGTTPAIESTGALTIYGQGGETEGKLNATTTTTTGENRYGMHIKNNLTINGGVITATGTWDGIKVRGDYDNRYVFTINGGYVSGIAGNIYTGLSATYGDFVMNGGKVNVNATASYCICGERGNIFINGGQIDSPNSDMRCYNDGNIILGWTNSTDFIKAKKFEVNEGKVKIAAGKRFVAYNAETGVAANASSLLLGSISSTDATEIPNTISLTDATADLTIAGKTLRPLDGYYVKDEAGLTFNGKTNADGSAKPDFTITTGTGNNAVTTPYYIYKASTDQNPVSVVVNSTGHADDHMEISATTATAAITQSDAEASSHCFAMPAADVTITGIKYYTYGVDYIDPTAAANEQAKTTSENTKVYILEGNETTLGAANTETWHVAQGTLNYTRMLKLNGTFNLILADNATMTVESGSKNTYAISTDATSNITIYGQSKGTGSLTATVTNETATSCHGIYPNGGSITINGGKVKAIAKNDGIHYYDNTNNPGGITINGGELEAIGTTQSGIYMKGRDINVHGGKLIATGGNYGISYLGDFTISGGQVETNASSNTGFGIHSNVGNITLGWTNPDDYIYTNSYHLDKNQNPNQVIKIAAGKRFVAYDAETGVAANASSLLLGSISSTDATEIPNTISLDDATANLTIAGKYLRPLDGYTVANSAGVLLDGKTETVNNIVVAKPDFTIENSGNVIPYYTYKENATVTVASTGHDTDHMEINADFDLNQTEEQALAHSFQMLNKDIILQNVKYYNLKVPYLTWDDTKKKLVSAETGDYDKVYLLQGTETTLSDDGETWYVAKGNVDYTNKLTLNHDTHIILADNANMTVGTESAPIDDIAIGAKSADITIYGQSTASETMGHLTTVCTASGIEAYSQDDINVNVTINGGYIDTSKDGIYSTAKTANVIINGGIVEANSIATFADGDTKVIINSGNVTVSDEIEPISTTSTAETILSWTNPTDYVNAKSYSGTVKIAQGKYFSTSDASYGSKDADYVIADVSDINGKKLMPTVAVQTGNAAFLDMCSTDGCYKVMGNAKAFPVVGYDITHKTVKLGAALAGVPNGVPVVICTVDGEGNPTDAALGADVMLVCATGQDAIDIQNSVATEGGNMPSALFFAGDANKTWEQLLEAAMQSQYPTADATQLASLMSERMFLELANGRFRPVAVNLANTSKLGKALLTITKYDFLKMIKAPATAAPGFHGIAIELGEETGVTGVREVKEVREVKDNTWYSLDGRKLDGAPNKKGIYVVNGHKVVIR